MNEDKNTPSPVSRLRVFKRYDEHPDGSGVREDELGAYVKYDDVKYLLATQASEDEYQRGAAADFESHTQHLRRSREWE